MGLVFINADKLMRRKYFYSSILVSFVQEELDMLNFA